MPCPFRAELSTSVIKKSHFHFYIPMKKYTLLFVALLICGCNSKPQDVPELYPCQVTVTNGGTPIAEADVILGLTSESSSASMTGITNSSGVATMYTKRLNWKGQGVPAGEYIVTISKNPKLEEQLSRDEYYELTIEEQDKYNAEQQRKYDALPREIPGELSAFGKSPYRMTVSKGGDNKLKIDIATFAVPAGK